MDEPPTRRTRKSSRRTPFRLISERKLIDDYADKADRTDELKLTHIVFPSCPI
jgi:hypothetical protein